MSDAPRSTRYQDYVIRDGRLVGEFDAMYRNASEVPWHQDQTAHAVFSDLTVAILRRRPARTLLDVGCGLGYMTDRIRREVPGLARVVGVDVSDTAVAAARRMFPAVEFAAGTWQSPPVPGPFDMVVSKDVLWYVVEELDAYLASLARLSARWVYVGQSFPDARPFYGDRVLPDAGALFQRLRDLGYAVVYSVVERDKDYGGREYAHAVVEVTA